MKAPGQTPLIRLFNIEKDLSLNCFLYAKVEGENPSGSIKDRTVYGMLLTYQKDGLLKQGTTIVEATSGNTGISLSYYSKEFHYECIIVMPSSASIKRRELISKYGAQLVLVEGGMVECNKKAQEIVKNTPNSFVFNQFSNLANINAHFSLTAPEINKQLSSIDYLIAGFGTGGTISGIGKFYKENKINTQIVAVEPIQSPLITKGYAHSHKIEGIGANFVPDNLKKEFVDEIVDVDDEESIKMAKYIFEKENLFVGVSSGAALLGALSIIKKNNLVNKNIVIIFPDKGDRYIW